MKINLPTKPLAEIERVINCLEKHANIIKPGVNNIVLFKDRNDQTQCILLASGVATLIRDDGVIVGVVDAPMIIGQIGIFNYQMNYKTSLHKSSIAYKIPAKNAEPIINSNNLWRDIACITAYNISLILFRESHFSGNNAYALVKGCLQLITTKNEYKKINVPKYIMDRTLLSRSIVMKILRDLKRGGYITMENGKALTINNLPANY